VVDRKKGSTINIDLRWDKQSITISIEGDKISEEKKTKKIKEIELGDKNINIRGTILYLNHKKYENEKGVHRFTKGKIKDETGTIIFTSWSPLDSLKEGDTVLISNGTTTEFQGNTEINISERGKVKKEEKASDDSSESKKMKINDIEAGIKNLIVQGKIVYIDHDTYRNKNGEQKRSYGIIGDDTDTIGFNSWIPLESYKKGDKILIKNAYTEEYKGKVEIKVPRKAKVEKYNEEKIKSTNKSSEGITKKIEDIEPSDTKVCVKGKIVSLKHDTYENENSKHRFCEGKIKDKTGIIDFTTWFPLDSYNEGDGIIIKNGYPKEFNGKMEIKVSSKNGKDNIERYQDHSPDKKESDNTNIEDVELGESNIDLKCKIVSIDHGSFEKNGKEKRYCYGIIGDETGTIGFTTWFPLESVEKGDKISIENGYTKEFKGKARVNVSKKGKVRKINN